jgi:hypothetical protein
MSNHRGSYLLCDVLALLTEADVWERLPRATTQQLVLEIVNLAYNRYDCNAGEILDGHDAFGICYSCRSIAEPLKDGLCQACGDDEDDDGQGNEG